MTYPLDQYACQAEWRSIALLYEDLAQSWETDEMCDLWTDEYADAMATRCWAIAMQAQTQLLRFAETHQESNSVVLLRAVPDEECEKTPTRDATQPAARR